MDNTELRDKATVYFALFRLARTRGYSVSTSIRFVNEAIKLLDTFMKDYKKGGTNGRVS